MSEHQILENKQFLIAHHLKAVARSARRLVLHEHRRKRCAIIRTVTANARNVDFCRPLFLDSQRMLIKGPACGTGRHAKKDTQNVQIWGRETRRRD
jgi:hypothetical protein